MRSANYVNMTTTSIAGTSGDGAVTMTALSSRPSFTTVFGSTLRWVRYIIEDTVNFKFETGIGSVSSNVLTRTRPQITWDGTTYDDSTPSALQFGASPTSGNVIVRLGATAEVSQSPTTIEAVQSSLTGDSNWRDFWHSPTFALTASTPVTLNAVTADREYYLCYQNVRAGLLNGIKFEAVAGSSGNVKMALYDVGSNGEPGQKIVDFVTTATTTGIQSDTATGSWSPAGPVWLTPGWYYIGLIFNSAVTLKGWTMGSSAVVIPTPLGQYSANYGFSCGAYVAGNYTTGLPAAPSLSGGTLLAVASNPAFMRFGLRVVP